MRSLANGLRAIALAALALWIVNAAWPRSSAPEVVDGSALAEALPGLTLGATGIVARLDHVPHAGVRDWLAALRDAGVTVHWSGDLAPVAVETYAAVDPGGGAFVLVGASGASTVSDGLGPIDTLEGGRLPALVRLDDVRGDVLLALGPQRARASIPRATTPRRVLVVGAANWESKFIVAALEETGWQVDARLRVRPDHVVAQGGVVVPDRATHAVVVLLDTTSTPIGRLEPFIRAGGGLILAGDGTRARVAAPVIAWRAGRRESAPLGSLPDDTLWRGLSRIAFENVDTTRAIVLERRDGNPVVVARRHHGGRVLAVGYDETWRWRMAGGANSVAEHRRWWSRHVASVAFRPAPETAVVAGSAPLAALHAALGPPSDARHAPTFPRALIANVLGAIAFAALLGEWFIRRLHGMA